MVTVFLTAPASASHFQRTNNEYLLRFSDLSKRVDKSITLHRYVTDDYSSYYYRTFTNEAFYTLSYPFSEILSLKGTAIYRLDHRVNLAIDDYSLADKDTYENWGGVRPAAGVVRPPGPERQVKPIHGGL